MRRWVAPLLVTAALVLFPAAPASAHTVGGVGATNFRTALTALAPATPGVDLRVIENGSRLQLANTTATEVVVAGYGGEPYARVGPAGVFLNDNSPATYVNADRHSRTAVPAGVDPAAPPRWRQVGTEPVLRWHDHRVHWMLQSLPPAVVADPGREHRISTWTLRLAYGGQPLTATGTLDWIPGPSPWPWVGLALLVAGAVAATGLLARPHRLLALAAAALVAVDLAHGLGAALVTVGTVPARLGALFGSDALLLWPFAGLGAWLLWRRHTRALWLATPIALVIAIAVALDDAPALWRSSAPTALAMPVERAAVAVVLGLGLGLALALPVMLWRHPPAARPWVARPAAPLRRTRAEPAPLAPAPPQPGGVGEPAAVAPSVGEPAGVHRRQVAGYLAAGALGALAGAAAGVAAAGGGPAASTAAPLALSDVGARRVPYHGENQPGIVRPERPQARGWVAAFDLTPAADRAALGALLRRWTDAAAALMDGRPLGGADDAVVAGLGPAALTVTVGFGHSLFGRAGIPASARPEALVPLPGWERLDPSRSDGDLGVVVAADDPLVVAHAARVLTRLAAGTAVPRWQMGGFNAARGAAPEAATPRNLMGQVDGTNNPRPTEPGFAAAVFATDPGWLLGGSYLVVRRIRMLLDDWDRLGLAEQEQVIGRRKDTGAPLTGGDERSAANFGVTGPGGGLVIPMDAHIRRAAPAFNRGAAVLRRGFSYVDGMESGLLFLAWQADPRRGFIPVQRRLAEADALNRFIRHEAGALFVMPGGVPVGGYIGQSLVEGS